MREIDNALILFIILFFNLLVLGCQERSESAPFFDGLHLKYYEVFGNTQNPEEVFWTRDIDYRFKHLEDGNYHVSQKVITQREKKLRENIEPTPYPQVGKDLTLDRKGIVLKGGDTVNFIKGYPSYLWLPLNKRKKGAEILEGIREIEGKIEWEKREVWSAKGVSGDKYYYDVETGILIGSEFLPDKIKMILTDTNLSALKTSPNRN